MYAATVYLQVVNSAGRVHIHFIMCKTKITPLKNSKNNAILIFPRLELCAALLLAQLLHEKLDEKLMHIVNR